jgi:hypothetical protein
MPDASTQTDQDETLSDILQALRDIREDTHRNSLVAEKYGKKGDAIFDIVDKMSSFFTSPFRMFAPSRTPLLEYKNLS